MDKDGRNICKQNVKSKVIKISSLTDLELNALRSYYIIIIFIKCIVSKLTDIKMCSSLNNFFANSYLQQYNSTNNNDEKLTKNYFTTQEISNLLAIFFYLFI